VLHVFSVDDSSRLGCKVVPVGKQVQTSRGIVVWCFDLECLTIRITAVRSSETSETAYPTTWIFGNAALKTSNVTFSLQCCFCTQ